VLTAAAGKQFSASNRSDFVVELFGALDRPLRFQEASPLPGQSERVSYFLVWHLERAGCSSKCKKAPLCPVPPRRYVPTSGL